MGEKKEKQYVSDNAQLMAEWDWEKNNKIGYDPQKVTCGSDKKVWWHCEKGHRWEMSISQRTRGQGCPYCSNNKVWAGYNDLATTHPEVAAHWDIDKNTISPQSVTYGSYMLVWWKCFNGHSFQKRISKMVKNLSCPICSGHLIVDGINDFATYYPEIAKEWHPTKNGELTPSDISRKSGRKIWWMCQHGHEWQATPRDRTDGTGCPTCSQRRVTSFPEQAILYYVQKLYPDAINRYKGIFDNGMELDIYIPSIRLGIEYDGGAWHDGETSHAKERKKYEVCQRENITLFRIKERKTNWKDVADVIYYIPNRRNRKDLSAIIQAILDSIDRESNIWTRKNLRQYHSRIKVNLERDENEIKAFLTAIPNSLVDLRPDLVEEWHPTKNGNLKPSMFGINSNDRAWWKCKNCGHEWRTTIIHRGGKRNSGCPECSKKLRGKSFVKNRVAESGSLAENNPILAKEWHPTKNGELTPYDITEKRFKYVWWLCPTCGHEWEASPNSRSTGIGCPCCSGRVPKVGENDFITLYPELAKEWDSGKNSPYTPDMFLPKSGKKMWWKCLSCGHEWETEIRIRANGHGCPKCSRQKRKNIK